VVTCSSNARKPLRNLRVKCHTHVKAIFYIPVMALLLVLSPSPCFALRSIALVSKERAKEMGIEIRTTANGPKSARVELEFQTKGELKNFNPELSSCVELRIMEGEKDLVTAALQEKRTKPGRIVVSFTVDRAQLDKSFLTVVVGQGAMAGGAYELRVKDFVALD
jgi:hypothetical protein